MLSVIHNFWLIMMVIMLSSSKERPFFKRNLHPYRMYYSLRTVLSPSKDPLYSDLCIFVRALFHPPKRFLQRPRTAPPALHAVRCPSKLIRLFNKSIAPLPCMQTMPALVLPLPLSHLAMLRRLRKPLVPNTESAICASVVELCLKLTRFVCIPLHQ